MECHKINNKSYQYEIPGNVEWKLYAELNTKSNSPLGRVNVSQDLFSMLYPKWK